MICLFASLTFEDWKNISSISFYVISALVVVWRLLWVPSTGIVKKINSIINSIPTIEQIGAEFRPNGGNSLRDVVNRLEVGQSVNRENHRMVLQEIGTAAFEVDKNGQYVWVSPRWVELTNIPLEKSLGNGWINSVAEVDRGRVFMAWQDALDQGRDFICEYLVNDETLTLVRNISQFVFNKDGEKIALIGKIIPVEK